MNGIRNLFLATITAKCDEPCPAVQREIDKLARGNRGRMLAFVGNTTEGYVSDFHFFEWLFGDARWTRADFRLATGRTWDAWIDAWETARRIAGSTAGWDAPDFGDVHNEMKRR